MKNLNFKLAFIIAILSVYFGFFAFDTAEMKEYYQTSAYFFMMFLCGIWLYISFKYTSNFKNIFKYLNNNRIAILASILFTAIMFTSCKAELRILGDESNLIGISKSILSYPHNINTLMSEVEKNDEKFPIRLWLNKRPLLYSFTLYILHRILGYSYINAFILNGFAAFGCFVAIYYLANSLFKSKFYGIISIILLASYPVFILSVTSAGFEILNLFWALVVLIVLLNYLRNKTANNSEYLIYTALMLAFTRYEEPITFLILIFMIWINLPKYEYNNFTKLFSIWPIFCLPICWLNLVTYTPEYLEVNSLKIAFGIKHLFPNLINFFEFLLNFNSRYGNVKIYTLLTIATFFIILTKLRKLNNLFIINVSAYVIFFYITHSIVRFFLSHGNLTQSHVNRLGIIYIPLLVFASLYYIKSFVVKYKIQKNSITIFAIFILIYNINISGNIYATKELSAFKFLKATKNIFERYFPIKNDYILMSDGFSNYFTVFSYNTVDFMYFDQYFDQFKDDIINNHIWKYILYINTSSKSNNILKNKYRNYYNNILYSREIGGGKFTIFLINPNKS